MSPTYTSSARPYTHQFRRQEYNTFPTEYDSYDPYYSSPHSAFSKDTPNTHAFDAFTHALALLQQPPTQSCMNDYAGFVAPTPTFALQTAFPTYEAVDTNSFQPAVYGDWQMHNSMGIPAVPHTPVSFKRARGHQRTPSASTVASNGPASPYTHSNYAHPQIANTDFAPQSPVTFADQAGTYSKNLLTPLHTPNENFYMGTAYMPSVAAHTGAHDAMKGFAIDHHNGDL
ncbi:hypothetical protein LTR48_008198, partial [Friedmanniomyces endolithicus]